MPFKMDHLGILAPRSHDLEVYSEKLNLNDMISWLSADMHIQMVIGNFSKRKSISFSASRNQIMRVEKEAGGPLQRPKAYS